MWYDLVVPDFSKGKLAISDVLLASASAFRTPTVKQDPVLGDALPGPPTTVREFPIGDEIAVFDGDDATKACICSPLERTSAHERRLPDRAEHSATIMKLTTMSRESRQRSATSPSVRTHIEDPRVSASWISLESG